MHAHTSLMPQDVQPSHPHVSVIVPNYNYEPYLRQRIDSILAQIYQDFELILLDDASSDGSADVLQSYSGKPHISSLIINEENSGSVFRQWSRGLSLASGDLIWIAEADDWAEPSFLQKCVEVLDGNPDIILCQTGANIVDSKGNNLNRNWDLWSRETRDVAILDGELFINRILRYHNAIYNASGVVFRRGDYETTIKEACSFRACGDWLFWIDLAMLGKCAVIKQRLNNFRKHSASASSDNDGNAEEDIRIFEAMIRRRIFSPSMFSHGFVIKVGILRRKIKHVSDKRRREKLAKQLNNITNIRYSWPYHYSQAIKLISRLPWLCLHPMLRKI